MNESIFLQRRYREKNREFSLYGCYFLSLCYASQFMNSSPAVFLQTEEDMLGFAKLAKLEKWISADFTVLDPLSILKHLTGKTWKQLTSKQFGLFGQSHFLPIKYPVPEQALEIACYRAKEDKDNTHFSIVDEEGHNIFNTLGAYWLTNQRGRFFALDKRVYVLAS